MSKPALQNLVVRYGANDRIYSEGDPGATMFVVQAGKVRLFREIEGSERDLGLMEKGDFFGEMSILEGLPRTSSAMAAEESDLIEINSMTFDRMIKGNIEIAIRLLRKLSIRLREAERKNVALQAGGARVASAPAVSPASSIRRTEAHGSGPRLESVEGDGVYAVNSSDCMIGRFDPVTELKPDVDLTDLDLKRSVSRRHARIVRVDNGHALVEEVGALNGTFVNATRLITGQPHPLSDGDEVGVGTVKMTFRT